MTYNLDIKARVNDQVWPLRSILEKLVKATDHLLRDHDCDTHGHEEFAYARDAALAILDNDKQYRNAGITIENASITPVEREVRMIMSPGRCLKCDTRYDLTTAGGAGMIQNVCLYCSGEIVHYCNYKCSPPHNSDV